MYDGGQVLHEQNAQLALNLLLQVVSHKGYGIKRRRNLERLERVVSEDERQALLLGEDENDEAGQADVGQGDLQRNGQARCGGQGLWRGKVRLVGQVCLEGICLDLCLEGQEGVAGIRHFEDAPKAILGQVANLEYLQLGRGGAQVQLGDNDVVDDDGGLGRLV